MIDSFPRVPCSTSFFSLSPFVSLIYDSMINSVPNNYNRRLVRTFFCLLQKFILSILAHRLLADGKVDNIFTDGHVHSLNMVDESGNLPGFTLKIVDLEEADKETMHLLVFLLMQFLSRQDQVRYIFENNNFF